MKIDETYFDEYQNISEEFGIKEYSNNSFHDCALKAAEEVRVVLSDMKSSGGSYNYTSNISSDKKNSIDYFKECVFVSDNVKWLKEFRIYVSDGMYVERGRCYKKNEDDFVLLTNTAEYKYIDDNGSFIKKDIIYEINTEDEYGKEHPVVNCIVDYENKVIERCCIIVSVVDYDENKRCYSAGFLAHIIEHELGHAFDLMMKKVGQDEAAKEQHAYEFISKNIKHRTKYNELCEILYNYNLKFYEKFDKLKNRIGDVEYIKMFLCNAGSYITETELHQYLRNFSYDVDDAIKNKNYITLKRVNGFELKRGLCSFSPDVYNQLYSIYQLFEMFIKDNFISNKVKRKFAEDVIG